MQISLIFGPLRAAGRCMLVGLVALSLGSCGVDRGPAETVPALGAAGAVATIFVLVSSPELGSADTEGSEVTLTAWVKNATGTAVPNVPVIFTADSGTLSAVATVSDLTGRATTFLGTPGNQTRRRINVTASAGGKSASSFVDVVGTRITWAGDSTIASGGTGEFTMTVKDSANAPVANVAVTLASQNNNPIAIITSGGGSATTPLTNTQGEVMVRITGIQPGGDTLLARAQGVRASLPINVNAAKLTVGVVDETGNSVSEGSTSTSCQKIVAHCEMSGVPQSGTVTITTSRGHIYSDSRCLIPLPSGTVAVVSGDSQASYLRSETAGIATITASVADGPTAQATHEFIAALTDTATLSFQAEPAYISTNSETRRTEQSTLTAIVQDGSINNNFVKNAVVKFAIVTDPSGGSLSQPSTLTTGSDGAASVVYFPGPGATYTNGVSLTATIHGTSVAVTTFLTVARKSMLISAGTDNQLISPTASTYQQDYVVFVIDAAGNPAAGTNITATVIPTRYRKGTYQLYANAWEQNVVDTCANEDRRNLNGILDLAEDSDNSGTLEPGVLPWSASGGTTDEYGVTRLSFVYPRAVATWLEVKLVIRGALSGQETNYTVQPYFLPILATDVGDASFTSSGSVSPYGTHACHLAN